MKSLVEVLVKGLEKHLGFLSHSFETMVDPKMEQPDRLYGYIYITMAGSIMWMII